MLTHFRMLLRLSLERNNIHSIGELIRSRGICPISWLVSTVIRSSKQTGLLHESGNVLK